MFFQQKKYFIIVILLLPVIVFSQNENLKVLDQWLKYSDVKNALYHHYAAQAFQFLDERETEIAKLSTEADWEKRQEKVRRTLLEIVGPFPEKTPLNAHITGVIQKDGYRLEKIFFESQPGFYVTAAMFIPNKLKGKTASIIFTSGHIEEAFRWLDYQQVCINFVEKGFIVFAFDPLGQGERLQYYEPELKKSHVGNCVAEHSYVGAQCFLIGSSLARYMIWDGIRAVDYLLTRDEVDPQRIGITGHSGGGTQSTYIAAFDDRILAVAPECYITNMRRLWEWEGPADAEQNFFHGIASGIDLADLLEVRAPKPALQITTTQDFFSIQGAMETEKEVKKIYRAFGADEKFSRVEDDAPHGVTKKNREARNAFFQKHFDLPGDPKDHKVEYLTPDELQITETGQVSTSLGGETVFSLNRKEAQKLVEKLNQSRKNLENHLQNSVTFAEKLSGYLAPHKIEKAVFTGRYQRDGYAVEKYFIKGEGDYPIPFLLFLPENITGPPVIYINPQGKEVQASVGGEIESYVNKGHPVLAPDLVGTGEMGPNLSMWGKFDSNLGIVSYKHWFGPVQIARSNVGIHAGDIQRLVLYLKQHTDLNTEKIYAVARGNSCPALLHAAAFENSFSRIALIDPLISYRSMVMNKYYHADAVPPFVAGALTAYDLPDLAASLAPDQLLLVNVKDPLGNPAPDKMMEEDLAIVKSSFSQAGAEKNLKIIKLQPQQSFEQFYSTWLQ